MSTYYVKNGGDDSADGLSDGNAWETISKVNEQTFSPGDVIQFNHGDTWRELLRPNSGDSTGYIYYASYGSGAKPLLLGSYNKSDAGDWTDEGSNIWSISPTGTPTGSELLPNPSFDTDTSDWYLFANSPTAVATGARTTTGGEFDSAPAGYKIDCTTTGSQGSDIQFYTYDWSVTASTWYMLTFRAKATAEFAMDDTGIKLHSKTTPYNDYYDKQLFEKPTITTSFTTHTVYFRCDTTAADARITFYFGADLPNGETVYIDTLSFKAITETDSDFLDTDVGNLIFDNEDSTGWKVWAEEDLDAQDKFWYDIDNYVLKMYSTSNPGTLYSVIECAMYPKVIDTITNSYIAIQNLDIRYTGSIGVSTSSGGHHIKVQDCDFSYIGGGHQTGSDEVRLGNGVQFWDDFYEGVVERCYFSQIYDAAVTGQGTGTSLVYNIYIRNNVITNCEYSYEHWYRPAEAIVYDVYFENNTCLYAGTVWSHDQRPLQNGRHLSLWNNPAQTTRVYFRNNIFYVATESAIRWNVEEDVNDYILDNNLYYQPNGTDNIVEITAPEKIYTYAEFSDYQSDTGNDPNSVTGDPLLDSNYKLQSGSPAIGAGVAVTYDGIDYRGGRHNRPPDIGAVAHNTLLKGCLIQAALIL